MDPTQHHHHHLTTDEWDAVAANSDFQALERAKRGFVIPAAIFFLAFYFALFVGLGWFPSAMMRPVWGPLPLGVALALAQFVSSWILLALYLRRARSFDHASEAIVERTQQEYAG